MGFICKHHRQHVLASPPSAIKFWDQWMEQANLHLLERDWREATRYIGCSFEVSQWLLEQPELIQHESSLSYLDRFMVSGHQLTECMGQQQQSRLELHFLLAVHIELMSRARTGNHQHWHLQYCLQRSMGRIKLYCTQHGDFKGYNDCLHETAQYLKRALH